VTQQLESRHYFRIGDTVRAVDGRLGTVLIGSTLFALVYWETGKEEEVDQFDPTVLVVERAVNP
jgi:hypothetical protein